MTTIRYATQRMIPRADLVRVIYPSSHIGYVIEEMLDELIAEQHEVGTLDLITLGIGGRWDGLADAFLLSAKVEGR